MLSSKQIQLGLPVHLDGLALPTGAKELTLNWVAAGKFLMGESPHLPGSEFRDDPFEVKITRGYWLGRFPVTQAQWIAAGYENPSKFAYDFNCPVETITWSETVMYCDWLNHQMTGHLPPNYKFRPPTEAEWEYACRAGTATRFNLGPSESDLSRAGWYFSNSGGRSHPVGEKEPNAWGFYDCHGNVWEWCWDPAVDYPAEPMTDWNGGRHDENNLRINRGGSWGTSVDDGTLCSAGRGYSLSSSRSPAFGMRLALSVVVCD